MRKIMRKNSPSLQSNLEPVSADSIDDVDSLSAEERIAKHGFLISDDVRGTPEADQLAEALADILESFVEQRSKET
jgi:hypothetical protein